MRMVLELLVFILMIIFLHRPAVALAAERNLSFLWSVGFAGAPGGVFKGNSKPADISLSCRYQPLWTTRCIDHRYLIQQGTEWRNHQPIVTVVAGKQQFTVVIYNSNCQKT
jgi:hypothetical protein